VKRDTPTAKMLFGAKLHQRKKTSRGKKKENMQPKAGEERNKNSCRSKASKREKKGGRDALGSEESKSRKNVGREIFEIDELASSPLCGKERKEGSANGAGMSSLWEVRRIDETVAHHSLERRGGEEWDR